MWALRSHTQPVRQAVARGVVVPCCVRSMTADARSSQAGVGATGLLRDPSTGRFAALGTLVRAAFGVAFVAGVVRAVTAAVVSPSGTTAAFLADASLGSGSDPAEPAPEPPAPTAEPASNGPGPSAHGCSAATPTRPTTRSVETTTARRRLRTMEGRPRSIGRGPGAADAAGRPTGRDIVAGFEARAGGVDCHEAAETLSGPIAIQTPHALQNARLGGLGTPQSQHSTDEAAGALGGIGRAAGAPAGIDAGEGDDLVDDRDPVPVDGDGVPVDGTADADGAPAADDRGAGEVADAASSRVGAGREGVVPAADATASVGRGGSAGATRESHSAQKAVSGAAGVPHMGQTAGVSTPVLSSRL
jgi:hypothetical protein